MNSKKVSHCIIVTSMEAILKERKKKYIKISRKQKVKIIKNANEFISKYEWIEKDVTKRNIITVMETISK